jgi:hypothetical protein
MVSHQKQREVGHLSESDLMHVVVDFANGVLRGPFLNPQAVTFTYGKTPETAIPVTFDIKELNIAGAPGVHGPLMQQTRADLTAIVAGNLAPRAVSRLKQSAMALTIHPAGYDIKTGKVVWQYPPDKPEAVLAHATLLLYLRHGTEQKCGDLSVCKLQSCGLLFFSADRKLETGRPREAYCCNEHMIQQHRLTSYNRVLAFRERKAAAKHK